MTSYIYLWSIMIIFQTIFKLWNRTRNCIWNHQRWITRKVWKRELSILYAAYCYDLFYIAVKYHDYIPKGIKVIERTRNCICNHQGEITEEVWKRELLFLYATHCHDLFYKTVKYLDYIPTVLSDGADTKLHLKPSREISSEGVKARVVILIRHTSSWPVLHDCEVSRLYSKQYSSY